MKSIKVNSLSWRGSVLSPLIAAWCCRASEVTSDASIRSLRVSAEQRDGETWGWHLLEAEERGLTPDYTIADGSKGLRAGQKLAWPGVPCHGDVFQILRDCKDLGRYLSRKAQAAQTKCRKLEAEMATAQEKGGGRKLSKPLTLARQREKEACHLASDVKTLLGWLHHDVFALAGPECAVRQELLAFIVDELRWREAQSHRIATLRRALQKQGAQLLAFARVLDGKMTEIARDFDVSPYLVRQVCLLQRKSTEGRAYWQRWNHLHQQLGYKFHQVAEAIAAALRDTPRSSSLVEKRCSFGEYSPNGERTRDLNSRLRNYFFLRRQLGGDYLELLRFFLNHRRFLRSERPERVGKSPAELMMGKEHLHWLELLGFERFRRNPA